MPRRWRLRLLAAALSLLLPLAAAEAALRYLAGSPVHPVVEPRGLKYAHTEWVGRGWAEGMPPRPRQGGYRVLAVGDSLTYGITASLVNAWPEQLRLLLRPLPVEIINLGVPGYDAEQVVTLITARLADWQPDLILWLTYTNDVFPTYLYHSGRLDASVFVGDEIPPGTSVLPAPLAPLARPLLDHSMIFRLLQGAAFSRANLTTRPGMDWYSAQLDRLQAWSAANDVPLLVGVAAPHVLTNPERCPDLGPHPYWCTSAAEAYRDISAALDARAIPRVDTLAAFREEFQRTGRESWFPLQDRDPDHPSDDGYALIARALQPAVADRARAALARERDATPGRPRPPRPAP